MTYRILHIITGLGSGGAEQMLYKLVTHQKSSQLKHIILCLNDDSFYGPKLRQAGIEVHTLNLKQSPLKLFKLYSIIDRLKPNLLQSWLYHGDFLALKYCQSRNFTNLYWNLRCSFMQTQHYHWTLKWIIKKLASNSDKPKKILVNSQAGMLDHIQQGYVSNNWKLIPNGFDLEAFKPKPHQELKTKFNLPENAHLIGHIARFDPMKDHATLLRAIALVVKQNPLSYFVLVGKNVDQTNSSLIKQIESLRIQKNIFLQGEEKDIPHFLNGLDLLVLSSQFGEGFPNVIGEAMSVALPVVATDVGDSSLIIGHKDLIAPPKNENELAQKINAILELTPLERHKMGFHLRNRIEKKYNLNKIIATYENFYLEELNI